MGITLILGLSILLQLTAAVLALRLIPITGRRAAWIFISVAIVLMASRRAITLIHVLNDGAGSQAIPIAEWVALAISVLLVMGISRIGPDFLSIHRAEKRMSKSEAELAQAQKIAHLGSWVFEIHSNELRWSDEVYRIFGLTPQEFGGTYEAFLECVHLEDREIVKQASNEAIENKIPCNIDHRIIRPDGEERIVHEQSEIVYDKLGKPLRMVGTVQDITERKRAEINLIKSQTLFQTLAKASPVGIFKTDADGLCTYVNARWCEIAGLQPEEAKGSGWGKSLHPDDREMVFVEWEQATKEERNFKMEYRFQLPNGEISWVFGQAEVVKDSKGNASEYVGTITNITEHKLAENQVQIREQQQAVVARFGLLALEGKGVDVLMQEAVELVASNLHVEFAKVLELLPDDKKFLLRTGVGWKEELVGTATIDFGLKSQAGFTLLAKEPVIVEDLNTETRFNRAVILLDHGIVSGLSVVIKEREKVFGILAAHTCKPRQFSEDDVNFLQAMANVLAEAISRKRAEAEKEALDMHSRQQQKLESIGLLAGGVAHEINNPINGIMNYAQLIQDRLEPAHPLREFSSEIIHETERVAHIIKNLLSFAREEKETHSPANISDIVEATLSLIRTIVRRDQIMLEVYIPDDLPPVKCRSQQVQQVQQVLMNLLTNARDALNERYPEYNPDKVINVTASLFREDEWVRITIEDHGMGIPEEIKERIFDPFFTTKDRTKGTGMGLAISYGIIKEHHGELNIETETEKYTRFHVDLRVNNGWSVGAQSGKDRGEE